MQAGSSLAHSRSHSVQESDSALDDSDFEMESAASSSDESLAPEYRHHVKNRELGDDWEEEVDDDQYNRAQGAALLLCVLCFFLFFCAIQLSS